MTDKELRIQELMEEIKSLKAESGKLQNDQQQQSDQRDITDAAGEKLRLTQVRYRTVFENSLLGNKIISHDLKILQVNQALLDMLGYNAKTDLIGRRIIEFAHPDYVDDWQILQKKLWSNRLPSFNLETCLVSKDGHHIWVNVNSTLFRDGDEQLGYTTIEDIRERKTDLDGLRIREEKFRTITNIMPQQVWTAAPNGRLNFVNQQVSDYLGEGYVELLRYGWVEYTHPDDKENCKRLWAQAVESGNEYTVEFRLQDKNGEYRWHLARATALKDGEGAVALWLGTNTDIHVQKDNEQRKDEFLSIVSHELKTPLTALKLYNELAQQTDSTDSRKEFTKKSAAHIIRLERLVKDLLDVTRINAGKMTYNSEPFKFDLLLKETVEGLQAHTSTHKLLIEANEPVTLQGDRYRIEQVINNIVLNAVKYSPNADRVIIVSKAVSDAVIVSVQDFGIGIAENDLARLFDRYYRADNSQMRFEGLGLGLYITAEIITRHNGSLWIESEPGKGSTFYFLIPFNGQRKLRDIETDHQSYYTGSFIEIRHNNEAGWLEANWKGYQDMESIKKGCMILLDLLKKNSCTKLLNDNSRVMGNWSEATDWVATYWLTAMQEAGLKQIAWIYSHSTFSRLAANKSIENATGNFNANFFDDKTTAVVWLSNSY